MIRIHRKSTIPKIKITKKRKKSIIPWRKDVEKFRRCQPIGPPLPPSCNHTHSKFECSLLGQSEMEYFHRKFYYTRNKAQQDAFILRYCQGRSPKRKSSVAQKDRKLTMEYYVPSRERNIQVCKEAFVGILRVNKSRINALLKSFYKVDVSKNSIQGDQSTLYNQGKCEKKNRKNMEDKNDLKVNSKSLMNIRHSAQRNLTFEYRQCKSECEPHDGITAFSILLMENEVHDIELTNQKSENSSVNEDDPWDWLNLDCKARRHRTFNWSPLKQTTNSASTSAVEAEVKKDNSELSHQISPDSSRNNVCKESVKESTEQIINNSRIYMNDECHVYESRKRRLKKLERINGKENFQHKAVKKKNSIHYSKAKQKPILGGKKIENNSLLKKNDNKFGQNVASSKRFPLRTLY